MVETHIHAEPESVADDSQEKEKSRSKRSRLIVWALASVGFVVYLAFGSVEARIWRYNRLTFDDRRIFDVWSYFGDQLPTMPAQPIFATLYYGAVAVMAVGTMWGLWFFLIAEDSSTPHAISSVDIPRDHG